MCHREVTDLTLSEKKQVVAQFLRRCNEYADAKLEAYRARGEIGDAVEALALADKISHWTAYKTFNLHALAELETSALDAWLD